MVSDYRELVNLSADVQDVGDFFACIVVILSRLLGSTCDREYMDNCTVIVMG